MYLASRTDPKFDCTAAHILVNCLAVALGTPKDTNHLYARIFNPKVLHDTKGPGSDHSHTNYDCGYQLHQGQLTNRNQIMGNNRKYRLALNTTVWAALSWCTLIGIIDIALLTFRHQ